MRKLVLMALSAVMLGTVAPPPLLAQSTAGAYLAGRHAAVRSDYKEAAEYYARALARDPSNVELIESTVLSYLSLGEIDKALPLVRVLDEKNQGSQGRAHGYDCEYGEKPRISAGLLEQKTGHQWHRSLGRWSGKSVVTPWCRR